MLTKCPECDLMISDKAISCPHCGYPLKNKNPSSVKSTKRRRLPNGFGQITKINGQRLRNPYRAMITIGKTDEGRPISKLLAPKAYFATYNEAYEALLEYNRNPYEIEKGMALKELFEKWRKNYKDRIAKSTLRMYDLSWKYCSAYYNTPIKEIKTWHIKKCMEESSIEYAGEIRKPSVVVQKSIKTLFNLLFDYAVEYSLVETNVARKFATAKLEEKERENRKSHIDFTDEEMDILWKHTDDLIVRMMLVQCYSGWRPSELCELKIENIDLDNEFMTGGMKTKAGTNRIVPIHSKICKLISKQYEESTTKNHLFLKNGKNISYRTYREDFHKAIIKYNLNSEHKPHDCRVQFITQAKKYEMNEFAIKYIVGHTIDDITEAVYTKRDPEWLKEEIEKIK